MLGARTRWLWVVALASFVLAGSTGAYYRFSLITPLPGVLENIRHAHSHLMFFSWVTPPLMLLVGVAMAARGLRPRGFAAAATLSAVFGLLTYAPFLKSGYHLTPFAGRMLPISMLASGLNLVAWLVFIAAYVAATWRKRRDAALRLFDVAVATMAVSAVGITGLAYLGATSQVQRPYMLALVDWYLTLFADGWFGLAVLALAAAHASTLKLARAPVGVLAWALGAGMVVRAVGRFANDALGEPWGAGVASTGAFVAAAMWLALVPLVWKVARPGEASAGDGRPPTGTSLLLRQLSLALLLVKGAVELIAVPPAWTEWMNQPAMRIFFLHAFLLGAVSFALIGTVRSTLGSDAFRVPVAFALAVGLMVGSLLPLTPLWPAAWAGVWVLRFAAFASLGPVVVATFALVWFLLSSRRTAPPPRAAGNHLAP